MRIKKQIIYIYVILNIYTYKSMNMNQTHNNARSFELSRSWPQRINNQYTYPHACENGCMHVL